MNMRNFILLAVLSVTMLGCVVVPAPFPDEVVRSDDYYYYDYRDTPSYEGYFYVRIIFIGGIPYYVDDELQAQPIPRHLRKHFIDYPYQDLRRSPGFGRNRGEREGYSMSRIVYFNGIPYYVEENRKAQALPNNVRNRFPYTPANQESNERRNERRDESPAFGRNRRDDDSQGYSRERDNTMSPRFERRRQDDMPQAAPARPTTESQGVQRNESIIPMPVERKTRVKQRDDNNGQGGNNGRRNNGRD